MSDKPARKFPDRHFPVRPNLDQLKHQAKDLLRAVRQGDPAAIAELRKHHPKSIEPAAAEIALLPKNYIKLEGKAAQQMLRLMEILEDHEDTKKVWTNADIEEKEIEASLA